MKRASCTNVVAPLSVESDHEPPGRSMSERLRRAPVMATARSERFATMTGMVAALRSSSPSIMETDEGMVMLTWAVSSSGAFGAAESASGSDVSSVGTGGSSLSGSGASTASSAGSSAGSSEESSAGASGSAGSSTAGGSGTSGFTSARPSRSHA